jgi:hypothetical protein
VAGGSDAAIAAALARVADDLAGAGDPLGVTRAGLRDALARRLRRHVGAMTVLIPDDTARLRGWPEGITVVDLGVRGRMAGRQRAVACCDWWTGDDERRRTVAGACRMASAARDRAGDAYLVAGGPPGAFDGDAPEARLFRDGERATLALLRDAGVEAVADGPALVPGRIRTTAVAREPLGPTAGGWELRAARMEAAGGDLQVGP